VRALSKLPADGIEAAAAVPEPLQNADGGGAVKLWGEDALLDWPGAMGPGELLPASDQVLTTSVKLRGEDALLDSPGAMGPGELLFASFAIKSYF
jgi:hypothetical protein